MPKLSKKEINQRLIRLRNLERLYPLARKRIDLLEEQVKLLQQKSSLLEKDNAQYRAIIEAFKLRIEELEKMVFGKSKKKDKEQDIPKNKRKWFKPKIKVSDFKIVPPAPAKFVKEEKSRIIKEEKPLKPLKKLKPVKNKPHPKKKPVTKKAPIQRAKPRKRIVVAKEGKTPRNVLDDIIDIERKRHQRYQMRRR